MLWALAIQSKSAAEVEDQIIGFYMRYLVGEKARQSGNSLMSHIYAFLRDTHALQRKHGFPLLEESFSPHNSLLLHGTLFHALNLFSSTSRTCRLQGFRASCRSQSGRLPGRLWWTKKATVTNTNQEKLTGVE